ncbi:MAG: hypothetical protein ACRC46_04395 [Thermoguttaceae bacterium]
MGPVEIILIAAVVGIFTLVVRGVGRASYETGGGCGCVGERRPLPTFDDDNEENDDNVIDAEIVEDDCRGACCIRQETKKDSTDANR